MLWPILSGIIAVMAGAGVIAGRIESWRIDESLYFAFVTGLTIGYGDFTPKHLSARLLAMAIAACGVVLIGLVSAISVEALRAVDRDDDE
ncbi:potassium channel family protein [Ensifer sesbaniae]|uniref:potassium channel family protein n=1 Tax=Ensifer sesbaniae TaxID=1214071 RepID=UPI0032D9BB2B